MRTPNQLFNKNRSRVSPQSSPKTRSRKSAMPSKGKGKKLLDEPESSDSGEGGTAGVVVDLEDSSGDDGVDVEEVKISSRKKKGSAKKSGRKGKTPGGGQKPPKVKASSSNKEEIGNAGADAGTTIKDPTSQELAESRRRTAYEANLKNQMSKIGAVKDRLVSIRFDYSADEDDIRRDVRNLTVELRRLVVELDTLNAREARAFEQSLKLGNLGLDPRLLTAPSLDAALANENVEKEAPVKVDANAIDDDVMDFPEENLKLMRTRSTETMKDKNPTEKWQGLFSMWKEWNHQDKINKAAAAARGTTTPSQQQMNDIRAAIISLQKRKQLSTADKTMLADLQEQLRALSKASQGGKAVVIA